MNDRFKFRLFDRKTGEMIYKFTIDSEGSFADVYGDKKLFVLQQCTGLKDKNGKLIYEGDVVKYTDCEGRETVGSLEVDRFNLLTFTDMVTCDFCEEWVDIVKAVFFTGNSKLEIIGNIYENKAMLGEKK